MTDSKRTPIDRTRDHRVICPQCRGTSFTDASEIDDCDFCGGTGTIIPERVPDGWMIRRSTNERH